ncbi:MAG: hypothetical protein ACE5E7_06020 [Anaerolineae bacterium]
MVPRRPFFFYALGYRRNPFGALTDEEWAEVAVLPSEVTAVIRSPFTHLQLLGPQGSGKSTCLLKLTHQFREQGLQVAYEYLPVGQREYHTETVGLDVFLLDEAQRLRWGERRRLLREAGRLRLVLGSHADWRRHFARRGVSIHTVTLGDSLTADTLHTLLARRLDYFALPGVERVMLAADAVAFLLDTFGGDLRKMEYFLYEVWQQQDRVTTITADWLRHLYRAHLG